MSDITVIRGDTKSLTIQINDSSGSAQDITGWTIFFTVKTQSDYTSSSTDDNAKISKTVTSHTDAANGESAIALTSTDTNLEPGTYLYDIQTKNASGDIVTIDGAPYNFYVVRDVTRRSS